MMDQDKPGPIHLNLDKWEHEREKRDVFNFVIKNKRYTMVNPEDIEWSALLGAQQAFQSGDPRPIMIFLLGDEQYKQFTADARATVAQLSYLIEKATQYYGLTTPGEAPASQP